VPHRADGAACAACAAGFLTASPCSVENRPMESNHRRAIHPALPYLLGGIVALWVFFILRSFNGIMAFRNTSAIFLSLMLEGFPFVLLGSLLASLVQEFVPTTVITGMGSRLGRARIPVVALSGFVLPICECAIVPTMRRLREKGLGLVDAITFLVAVPLINPVVIASTIVAFSDRPALILGRFLGGFAVILIVAGIFSLRERQRAGIAEVAVGTFRPRVAVGPRILHAVEHTAVEFVEVIGYYSVGAMLSAIVQAFVPVTSFFAFTDTILLAILAMIALAFLLSVCSEADAFIGRSFLGVMPEPAVLAFLVFGPMFDLKNLLLLRRVLSAREILLLVASLLVAVSVLGVVYASITV